MDDDVLSSTEEEFDSLTDKDPRGVVTAHAVLGVKDSHSETYGDLVFQCEAGANNSAVYSINFDDETEVVLERQNITGSGNFLYVLEALSRGISFEEAVEEIYVSGTERGQDIKHVLNDDTLEEEYHSDLSRLLEEEIWKEDDDEDGFQVS